MADHQCRRRRPGERHRGRGGQHCAAIRIRAGQLIVLLGAGLIVAGAMAGRGLSQRWASVAGLAISLALVALTVWYYMLNVKGPVAAGYGLYLGGAMGVLAALCSVWSLVSTLGRS